jgi:hypothetical protein
MQSNMAASLTLRSRTAALAPYTSVSTRQSHVPCGRTLLFVVHQHTDQPLESGYRGISHIRQERNKQWKPALHLKASDFTGQWVLGMHSSSACKQRRPVTIKADGGEAATADGEKSNFKKWDGLTTQLATSSTAAFLVSLLSRTVDQLSFPLETLALLAVRCTGTFCRSIC